MGIDFLPKFNEGTATIGISLTPGVSLEESDKFGNKVENILLDRIKSEYEINI